MPGRLSLSARVVESPIALWLDPGLGMHCSTTGASPTDGVWNRAANRKPATVLSKPRDTATFGLSSLRTKMPAGSELMAISNTSGNPIVGAFDGFPEGSVVRLGSANSVPDSYTGGDGNDFTLTVLPQTTVSPRSKGDDDDLTTVGR